MNKKPANKSQTKFIQNKQTENDKIFVFNI